MTVAVTDSVTVDVAVRCSGHHITTLLLNVIRRGIQGFASRGCDQPMQQGRGEVFGQPTCRLISKHNRRSTCVITSDRIGTASSNSGIELTHVDVPWLSPFGVGIGGFGFQVSGFRFQVSGFKFQVSGFRFQVSGFRFQVSGSRFQVPGFRFFQGVASQVMHVLLGKQDPLE